MSSSDRSDEDGSGPHAPVRAEEEVAPPAPPERSPRGRMVIRSSSHPPMPERPAIPEELSGARRLPIDEPEPRVKRDTPAERPRLRRQLRSAQLGERLRREAAAAHPGQRRRSPTSMAITEPGPAGAQIAQVAQVAPPPNASETEPSAGSAATNAANSAAELGTPARTESSAEDAAARRSLAAVFRSRPVRAALLMLGVAGAGWLLLRLLAR